MRNADECHIFGRTEMVTMAAMLREIYADNWIKPADVSGFYGSARSH
jgi:hypothetical protein